MKFLFHPDPGPEQVNVPIPAFSAMWEAVKDDKHNDLTDTDAWEAFAAEIRKLAEIIAD